MTNSELKTSPAAIVALEGQPEKLRACLHALVSWVSPIIVIHPENSKKAKQIAKEFGASTITCSELGTHAKWESGLRQINKRWAILLRSSEVITGQLRKSSLEQIKKNVTNPCQYPLPLTTVFLKKRLKYTLDWQDAYLSCLVHISENTNTISQLQKKYVRFDGELIRYSEDTLYDCMNSIHAKAEERANQLAQNIPPSSCGSLFTRGIISSIKSFGVAYFSRKGFKEGFEGSAFAACDALAELMSYLRYYELYIRGGKNLCNNLTSLRKILVIKLRDIGDNILLTPLLRNLKQHLPQTSISVLTWSYSKPVFEKSPHIHQLFDIPKNPSPNEISIMIDRLNSINFDLVISTHSGRLPSELLSKIKTKDRINNHYRGRNKRYSILTSESDYFRSAIERDLDCMRSFGLEPIDIKTEIFLTSGETEWARRELQNNGFDPEKKLILIHPTAGSTVKEWPIERFGTLLKKLSETENIQPLVLCTDAEFARIQQLLKYAPNVKIFHQLSLRQMMAIIKECDLVIDNDSSPSHVATAFGIPTIVLFGQGIREIFRPYHPENDLHYVFYNDVDCRDCELVHCDDRICLEFSPNDVFAKALEMIFGSSKHSA